MSSLSKQGENPKTPVKTRLIAIAVWAFLIFWLTGMTAGMTAGICRKPQADPAKVERYCTISLTAGSIFPGESHKRAFLFLYRGIARAKLGLLEEARTDMARAIRDSGVHGAYVRGIYKTQERHIRLLERGRAEPEGTPARELFEEFLVR